MKSKMRQSIITIGAFFYVNSSIRSTIIVYIKNTNMGKKKSGMTRTDGHSQNEEIEINKGYGILTT